jgi:transcriptional regulator with XRE-family HTH domain
VYITFAMSKRYLNLRTYFDAEAVTQAEFAASIGLSAPMLSQIVTGNRRPSLEVALKIAKAANVPVESLMTEAA